MPRYLRSLIKPVRPVRSRRSFSSTAPDVIDFMGFAQTWVYSTKYGFAVFCNFTTYTMVIQSFRVVFVRKNNLKRSLREKPDGSVFLDFLLYKIED